MPSRKATEARRQLFAKLWLADPRHNATQAYIEAGYKAKSEKVARVSAAQLLAHPSVQGLIQAGINKVSMQLDTDITVSVERVRDEIARLSFFDTSVFYNDDGSLKKLSEIPPNARKCIVGIESFERTDQDGNVIGTVRKFKLADKGANLERLGRHLAMFTDKTEHKFPDGVPNSAPTLVINFGSGNGPSTPASASVSTVDSTHGSSFNSK